MRMVARVDATGIRMTTICIHVATCYTPEIFTELQVDTRPAAPGDADAAIHHADSNSDTPANERDADSAAVPDRSAYRLGQKPRIMCPTR